MTAEDETIEEVMDHVFKNPLAKEILEIFILEGSGFWSAMQWFTLPEPNLRGKTPVELIWAKIPPTEEEAEKILWAARAYNE